MKAFKHLSVPLNKNSGTKHKFNCLFQNPSPNYYDGKFATSFESCIKDKFEGLTSINEIDADYVTKTLAKLEKEQTH